MPPPDPAVRLMLPAHVLLRKAWRRIASRNLTAADNHRQLNRLYALSDPWQMMSSREQYRFVATNALIEARLGRVGRILEIGCGEGHQSEHLARLCDHLDGLDVSARAVDRARARVAAGRFEVGTIEAVPWGTAAARYDLVVACEVLYYMRDVEAAVARLSALGDACLVTFFGPAARYVAPFVVDLPGVECGWFFHEPYAWLWAFWRPERE